MLTLGCKTPALLGAGTQMRIGRRQHVLHAQPSCGPYWPKQSFDGTSRQLRRWNGLGEFRYGYVPGGSRAIRGGQLRRTSSLVAVILRARLRKGSANNACALGCRGECL